MRERTFGARRASRLHRGGVDGRTDIDCGIVSGASVARSRLQAGAPCASASCTKAGGRSVAGPSSEGGGGGRERGLSGSVGASSSSGTSSSVSSDEAGGG